MCEWSALQALSPPLRHPHPWDPHRTPGSLHALAREGVIVWVYPPSSLRTGAVSYKCPQTGEKSTVLLPASRRGPQRDGERGSHGVHPNPRLLLPPASDVLPFSAQTHTQPAWGRATPSPAPGGPCPRSGTQVLMHTLQSHCEQSILWPDIQSLLPAGLSLLATVFHT